MKIREDLDGVVVVKVNDVDVVVLRAGDEIPEGAEVGDHLIAAGEPDELDDSNESDKPVDEDVSGETAAPAKSGPYAGAKRRVAKE